MRPRFPIPWAARPRGFFLPDPYPRVLNWSNPIALQVVLFPMVRRMNSSARGRSSMIQTGCSDRGDCLLTIVRRRASWPANRSLGAKTSPTARFSDDRAHHPSSSSPNPPRPLSEDLHTPGSGTQRSSTRWSAPGSVSRMSLRLGRQRTPPHASAPWVRCFTVARGQSKWPCGSKRDGRWIPRADTWDYSANLHCWIGPHRPNGTAS